MRIESVYTEKIAHISYLVGEKNNAAVIDPRRDPQVYLETAAALNLKITHILETHLHADFISGHLDLQKLTGATLMLPEKAAADFPHIPIREGTVIKTGDLEFRVLETPGHTPEHVCYVLTDRERGTEPAAVFTGDTLFVGDVGRPDLFPGQSEKLSRALFHSLHHKLMELPEYVEVYPAHGAGSLCGRAVSSRRRSTIGYEKRLNPALSLEDEEEFTLHLTRNMPPAPDHFFRCSKINQAGPALLEELPELCPIPPQQVLAAVSQHRAVLLDTRDFSDFAAGHPQAAFNLSTRSNYPTLAAWILDPQQSIILLAHEKQDPVKIATFLRRVGLDQVSGWTDQGISGWEKEKLPLASSAWTDMNGLLRLMKENPPAQLVDVRLPDEYRQGHIPGARHITVADLRTRFSELDSSAPIVLYCNSGHVAGLGVSILLQKGFTRVFNLKGGITGYMAAGGVPVSEQA